MPRLLGPDPDLPVVITRESALAAGLTDDQIAYRIATGRWERIAQGYYRRADWAPDLLDSYARLRLDHVHRAVLAVRRNRGSTIGIESAACVLGMPLISAIPAHVCLLVPAGRWTGTRHGICFRQGAVGPDDLSPHAVPVTSAVRTWTDIARTKSLSDALAAGDSALRRGLFVREHVTDAVAAISGARGCRRAQLALHHLDGIRETPLESASWAYFVTNRLPLPRMQVEIRTVAGRFIARVDFLWDEARVVGECDGRLKYASAEDVYAEKRREDDIRSEGYGMTRWGFTDLHTPDLARRIRRALA